MWLKWKSMYMKPFIYIPAFHNLLGYGGTFSNPIVQTHSLEFYLKFLHSWERLVYSLPLGACQICYQGHVCLKKRIWKFSIFFLKPGTVYITQKWSVLESLKERSKAFYILKYSSWHRFLCVRACVCVHSRMPVSVWTFLYLQTLQMTLQDIDL